MSEYIVKVEGQMPDAIYERELTEIVRCRDCEYYDSEPDMESMGEKCWRDPDHTGRSAPTVADGYCWRGERRDD